jgi:hypothetical protein
MAADSDRYVLVLDKRMDYVKVFRADSDTCPPGPYERTCNGLPFAYREMIRLNNERRPVKVYALGMSPDPSSKPLLKLVLGSLPEGWKPLGTFTDHKAGRTAMSSARAAHKADLKKSKEDADDAILKKLRKLGVNAKRVPRLTEKDRRYLAWRESKGDFFEDAA